VAVLGEEELRMVYCVVLGVACPETMPVTVMRFDNTSTASTVSYVIVFAAPIADGSTPNVNPTIALHMATRRNMAPPVAGKIDRTVAPVA
jgi:hypothetical protein